MKILKIEANKKKHEKSPSLNKKKTKLQTSSHVKILAWKLIFVFAVFEVFAVKDVKYTFH